MYVALVAASVASAGSRGSSFVEDTCATACWVDFLGGRRERIGALVLVAGCGDNKKNDSNQQNNHNLTENTTTVTTTTTMLKARGPKPLPFFPTCKKKPASKRYVSIKQQYFFLR